MRIRTRSQYQRSVWVGCLGVGLLSLGVIDSQADVHRGDGAVMHVGSDVEAIRSLRVFTTTQYPITDSGRDATARYVLDAPDQWVTKTFAGLPAQPAAAYAEAQRRMNDPGVLAEREALKEAFVGRTLLWSLGIQRVPAIVINDRYVFYGLRTVAEATRRYRAANASQDRVTMELERLR